MKKKASDSWSVAQASAESWRCLLCHEPPCSKACPANTDPAAFIRKLRFRNVKGAIRTINNNNHLGGACTMFCANSRLCEKECCLNNVDHPVAIGKIQDCLIDHGTMQKSHSGHHSHARAEKVNLSVNYCGIHFINPFLLAPSPISNTAEMVERAFQAGWGGAAFKTITTDRAGIIHPSPRMNAYVYGREHLTGLQNVEQISDRSLRDNLADFRYLKKQFPDRVLIASIMGFSNDEWAVLAKAAEDNGADMLELNFSCPHMTIEGSGHKVGQTAHLIEKFTSTVKQVTKIPVIAKLTPNITDITEPALAAKRGGADSISAINTVAAISGIGLDDWTPKPNIFGLGARSGYSGPAIKPIGLRFIADLAKCQELNLPLSGIGGIETWVDALEYLLVGATTVQVTTGVIHYGYRIIEDMIEGLADYLAERKISHVSELVGGALPMLVGPEKFNLKRQGIAEFNLDHCIGCGQCYTVCRDAGGQAISWDDEHRQPQLDKNKCLSCMACSFVCPVPGIIAFKEMPPGWARTGPSPKQ